MLFDLCLDLYLENEAQSCEQGSPIIRNIFVTYLPSMRPLMAAIRL